MNEIFNSSLLYKVFLGLVVIFLITSRFWNLSILPVALTHDEVVYAIQAKSLAVQKTFINQVDGFFSFQPAHPMYAEYPALILAPFFIIFKNPILATRIPSALISVAFPFVLSWFSYGLWKRRSLSNWVFVVSIFNPLLWQMGRLTYDAVLSTFFYFIGGGILLNTKGNRAYWSVPFFFLGFFQYQGYKLLLLPWVLFLMAVLLYRYGRALLRMPHFISMLLSLLILPVYLFFIMPNQNLADRWQKTIFSDTEYLSANVNDERRQTISNPMLPLVSNKLTALGKFLATRFLGAFSPIMLFLNGEPAQSGFAPWGYGWFHAIDSIMILIGFGAMWIKKNSRSLIVPICCLIVATSLPSLVNSGAPWYLLRMFFPNLILILFVAWGAWFLWKVKLGKLALVSIYSLSIFLFAYHFYFRYPIIGNHIGYLSEKVMAEYVSRTRSNNPDVKIYVHTVDPPVMFWTYLLYANAVNKSSVDRIAAAQIGDEYVFDNIVFTGKCADVVDGTAIQLSEAFRSPCDYRQSKVKEFDETTYIQALEGVVSEMITIPSIVDNGGQWRVYNDLLCNNSDISGFVFIKTYDQFRISEQDNSQFCRTWFSKV